MLTLHRAVLAGMLALLGLAAPSAWAEPAPYPHRVVALVTHSSPGGGSDVFLREMVRYLGKYLNATFIVENVQGGSGARAMSRVASAKPDGSIFYATTPTYVFTSQMSKPQSTFRDLEPLVNVFTDAEVLFTRADGPFKTLQDVLAHAKDKRGRWGVANPASLERQAAELLKRAANVNAAVVSHEGGGDMMINVLNGTLDIGIGEVPELRSQLEAGKDPPAGHVQRRAPAEPSRPSDRQGGRIRHRLEEVPRPRGSQGPPGRHRLGLGEGHPSASSGPRLQEAVRGGEPRRGLYTPQGLWEVH